jgi:hypothetical protein
VKRDMELVRKVLLAAQDGNQNRAIEGYTEDQILYHKDLVIRHRLAEGTVMPDSTKATEVPAAVYIRKLTWEGHDFIDAIADESNWNKVKDFLKDAGKQVTIETVKVAVSRLFGFGD